jgi:PEP-CTERM motif
LAGLDITNDFNSGKGPEVAILNAVGYNLASNQTIPEPTTFAIFGVSLAMLAGFARSRRKN